MSGVANIKITSALEMNRFIIYNIRRVENNFFKEQSITLFPELKVYQNNFYQPTQYFFFEKLSKLEEQTNIIHY